MMFRGNYDLRFSALLNHCSCILEDLDDHILYVIFLKTKFLVFLSPIHAFSAGGTGLTPGWGSSAYNGVLKNFFPKIIFS